MERVANQLDELPFDEKNLKIKKSPTNKYQKWFGNLSIDLQKGQALINKLEIKGVPTQKDIDLANQVLNEIQSKKDLFSNMEKPLTKLGFSFDVMSRLYAVMDKAVVDISHLILLLNFRIRMNELSEECTESIFVVSDRTVELARGSTNFSIEEDVILLETLQALERLQEECDQSEMPDSYKNEIFKSIAEEISSIVFAREEYCTDYRKNLEAAVAKISMKTNFEETEAKGLLKQLS